jgi:hypothetical protein
MTEGKRRSNIERHPASTSGQFVRRGEVGVTATPLTKLYGRLPQGR